MLLIMYVGGFEFYPLILWPFLNRSKFVDKKGKIGLDKLTAPKYLDLGA